MAETTFVCPDYDGTVLGLLWIDNQSVHRQVMLKVDRSDMLALHMPDVPKSLDDESALARFVEHSDRRNTVVAAIMKDLQTALLALGAFAAEPPVENMPAAE